MALVKYGGGIVQMSGSIAGNTFARNRYGNYVRARTKPINPNTELQQAVRAAVALMSEHWASGLSDANRTAWNLYADSVAMKNKLGETVKLSGYNHFCRSNSVLARFGGTLINAGPVVFELPEKDPTFAVTISEAAQQVSCAYDDGLDWADENGAFIYFYGGTPQNGQRNFFDGPWRYMGGIAGVNGAPPASPQLFAPPFVCSAGQRLWVYARIFRADGRISKKFRADCIVAA